jgi:hypothetical protein
METYRGSETEEQPRGGGKNNQLGKGGGERDNFLPDAAGHLHGYFAVGRGDQNINLFRVDGRPESRMLDEISPILVIFVAPHEDGKGAVIVGWYSKARLFRRQHEFKPGKLGRVEAEARESVLVPHTRRSRGPRIPRATPTTTGMGESNIFYMTEKDGGRRSLPWADAAIKYVTNYIDENALVPGATDVADPVTSTEVKEDQKAGFASNPRIRKAIEEHAMRFVEKEFKKQRIILEDWSKTRSYDFSYRDGETERFIEVKGSQHKQPAIILTANEVLFAREHSAHMVLCVVHSIQVKDGVEPKASGGILECFQQWNPSSHKLEAIQYQCKLNRDLAGAQERQPEKSPSGHSADTRRGADTVEVRFSGI